MIRTYVVLYFVLSSNWILIISSKVDAGQKKVTFHPRPIEITQNFLITEFGYDLRISQSGSRDDASGNNKNYHFTFNMGAMHNYSSRWAVGATVYYSLDDSGSRLALKTRLRRWLSNQQNIDISAGPIIANFGTFYADAPGFAGQLAYCYRDWIQATIGVELIPYDTKFGIGGSDEIIEVKGTESTLYVGIRVGSYPGLVSAVLFPILVFIHFLATYEA